MKCIHCGSPEQAKRVNKALICQKCKLPRTKEGNMLYGREAKNRKKVEDDHINGHRRNCFGDESEMLIDHFFCRLGSKKVNPPVHIASGAVITEAI